MRLFVVNSGRDSNVKKSATAYSCGNMLKTSGAKHERVITSEGDSNVKKCICIKNAYSCGYMLKTSGAVTGESYSAPHSRNTFAYLPAFKKPKTQRINNI